MLPLLQPAHLTSANTKELAALMREHVLPSCARHPEASAPSRNRFHAAVARHAEKCAVVGLQLDAAIRAARHHLQQAVAGRSLGVRLERRCAVGSEAQELSVTRLPVGNYEIRATAPDSSHGLTEQTTQEGRHCRLLPPFCWERRCRFWRSVAPA